MIIACCHLRFTCLMLPLLLWNNNSACCHSAAACWLFAQATSLLALQHKLKAQRAADTPPATMCTPVKLAFEQKEPEA